MKFKEWFLAWPDYVINNSEFTCIGGPQKWHFYIDENQAGINTVDLLRKEMENGWAQLIMMLLEWKDFIRDLVL